jgi:hypothetical protein
VQSLAEFLSVAQKARDERLTTKERETYRVAARHYPTAKEPWARLSESYFEAADYGNAIVAAQEVLQRDAEDPVATSVLAVSGLRVSTQALSSLSTRSSTLPLDTRTQAEGLTKTLRELLGETVLVPQPAEPPVPVAAPSAPRRQAVTRPTPRPVVAPQAAVTNPAVQPAHSAPRAAKPAAVAVPAPKSPFDALK